MTENDAIKYGKDYLNDLCNAACEVSDKHKDFVKMAIQALEKQIPKKPRFDFNMSDTLSRYHCVCGKLIKVNHASGVFDNNNAPNYCSNCGCKLDWSDKE